MRRTPAWIWIPALVTLAVGSPAHGEDEAPAPPAAKAPGEAEQLSEAERKVLLQRAKEHRRQTSKLHRAGKYAQAEQHARDALRLKERVWGLEDKALIGDLSNIAVMLLRREQPKDAAPILARALAIGEKAYGEDDHRIATTLHLLADVHKQLAGYDQAEKLLERALRLAEAHHGREHPFVAQVLNSLGDLLRQRGLHVRARPLLERAVAICEKTFGPDHPAVSTCIGNLGLVYWETGAWELARPLYKRALAMDAKRNPPGHPRLAYNLQRLGLVNQDAGLYDEALPLFERALKIRTAALGPGHPRTASSMAVLGDLLDRMGRSEDARPLLEKALQLQIARHGEEHPAVATMMVNVGSVLLGLGQFQQSIRMLERAAEVFEKTLGPKHDKYATSISALASALRRGGDDERAMKLLKHALRVRAEGLGKDHVSLAYILNKLGWLSMSRDRPQDALDYFSRAFELRKAQFGDGHIEVASLLGGRAAALEDLGRPDEARSANQRGLEIAERAMGKQHPKAVARVLALAEFERRQGRWKLAGEYLQRWLVMTELRMRRTFIALPPSERLAFGQTARRGLDQWIGIAGKLGRSGYGWVLRYKGLVARAAAAERKLARARRPADVESINALRMAERRVTKLANAAPATSDAKQHAAWQKRYGEAAAARHDLATKLTRDLAPLRAGLERMDLRLEHIQKRIPADAVLVDILRVAERYVAWIVRGSGPARRVDLGPAGPLDQAASTFASAVRGDGPGSRGRMTRKTTSKSGAQAWRASGADLRQRLWMPLAATFGSGVKTVYVCPDAALVTVPFAALPGSAKDRSLIDDYLLVSLSMAQDLVPWPTAPTPGRGALLLGGVDYGTAELVTRAAGASPTARSRAGSQPSFTPLAGTAAEVNFVHGRLKKKGRLLLGAEATEQHLREGVRGKRYVHLATHGYVRDDPMGDLERGSREWMGAGAERQLAQGHDPMLLAGLALTGANRGDDGSGDDGILTAVEASHLDLDGVELVVLSACETALGTAASGEGVLGLVRGFSMAGAKRVLGSLWKVDDEATRLLMERFYERLVSQHLPVTPAEALREAAQHLRSLKTKGGRSFAHPRYWGAFVIYGR